MKKRYFLLAVIAMLSLTMPLHGTSIDHSQPFERLPAGQRKQLAERLKKLINEHESLWLNRNRIGGLSDSSAEMEELLKMLEAYLN